MNIIVIVFDSLRKDCISTYGSPPWGKVNTPNLDAFAQESLVFTKVYPESLPTLPTRRALYTGKRVYPFYDSFFKLKGDFAGAPGWGPIPEEDDTLAELLKNSGQYRTGLISDVYHMFKPSKNFWRGFDQWKFIRGKETDPYRSGPEPSKEEIDYWLAPEQQSPENWYNFIRQCLKNMYGRENEEDYFCAQVLTEAATWIEQNRDAEKFFLMVESFDPHEPWFIPERYRKLYDETEGREQVVSPYRDADQIDPDLLKRAQVNYSGLVTMCDTWFGYFYEKLKSQGLLDDSIIIVTTDHGHSLGDNNYIGKRGYPSHRSVFDIPLMIRHPERRSVGERCDFLLQHTDISAQILDFAGIKPLQPIDGNLFWDSALSKKNSLRDHVTVAWESAVTVVTKRYWMNCKIDGNGVFLYDVKNDPDLKENIAESNQKIVKELFDKAINDAGRSFPEYLLKLAKQQVSAPGCSSIAASEN